MSYHRTFFVLKEASPGHGKNATPQGRCVIESRGSIGKALLYVQDLVTPPAQHSYKLVFSVLNTGIGVAADLSITIGAVPVTPGGRAELRYDFDPANVGGSGIDIKAFNNISIIMVGVAGHDGATVVLSGSNNAENYNHNRIRLASYNDLPGFSKCDNEDKINIGDPVAEAVNMPTKEPTEQAGDTNEPYAALQEAITLLNKEIGELVEIVATDPVEAEEKEPSAAESEAASADLKLRSVEDIHDLCSDETATKAEYQASKGFDSLTDVIETAAQHELEGWSKITLRDLYLIPFNFFNYPLKTVIAAAYFLRGNLIIQNAPPNADTLYTIGIPAYFAPEDEEAYKALGFHDFISKTGKVSAGADGY
ncbi:MAG: hypothetical protein FWC95_08645, partial [Defluviitaleaceae bacterium]|nr:hypothetical protein [Defluviitaleaceae bacterium]